MIVLIDNGHGSNTPGKCSPDGRLREWKYCREIAAAVELELAVHGIESFRIVPESSDVPLKTRCQRVNAICAEVGSSNVLLVSIHVNAASNGGWKNARGWTGWVYTKCRERSRLLAQCLYAAAEKRGLKGNRYVPACKYWTANYYITKHTNCPAVLTENLFQDNREDVDFLLSASGKKAIVDLHVEGILNYIHQVK
ncbi:MAG: N-acetylmuramoyl-L-alanine amidase [Bacteroidaceae bacterium]|nr:N-acetylmuramoyl-L-alanine amidase [Bacteroidaceae bacterium]